MSVDQAPEVGAMSNAAAFAEKIRAGTQQRERVAREA